MSRFLAAACVVALWNATAGTARADQVDDLITAELKRQNIPGLSLAVVRNGETVKAAGYGLASLDPRQAATPATVYHVGSISKQFVAAGVMLLVEKGRVALDDGIDRYLADLPAAWHGITIRQLLTHTSGLVRNAPALNPLSDQPDAEVMKTAYPLPLRFAPGERWEYSNLGYSLLGLLIGTVSGQPWQEFLRDALFKPAGMMSTYPVNTTLPLPNRAAGYTDNDRPRRVEDWRALMPAGGFLSTVVDLARYESALRSGRLLTSASQQQMRTPVTLRDGSTYPYGLGWELDSLRPDIGLVRHGGSLTGFRAEYARLIDHDLTIVLLMNTDDVDWRVILGRVADFYMRPAPVQP